MHRSTTAWAHSTVWAALLALAACVEQPNGLQPPGPITGTTTSGAGGSGGSSGGKVYFRPDIQADLEAKTCTSCHASGVPMELLADPSTDAEWEDNYAEVRSRAGTSVGTSLLLDKAQGQGAGDHPELLKEGDEELARWAAWIEAKTPYMEDEGAGASGAGASGAGASGAGGSGEGASGTGGSGGDGALTWDDDIGPLLNTGLLCVTCHGGVSPSADYSLETYDDAFGNGEDGTPNIIKNNANCTLVQVMANGHSQTSALDAMTVEKWVLDGAREN